MTTQELARATPRELPQAVAVALVPAGLALVGLAIRYLAWLGQGGEAGFAAFAEGLCRFDCTWYVRIAEQGYDPYPIPYMGNWAFFPLDPAAVAMVRLLVPGPAIVVASLVSVAVSAIAVAISWPLFERDWRGYVLFGAFVLAGPFSVYFTTFYTETAFLALTVALFVALRRSGYLAAGLFGALLSATRIVGVFAVFAIVVNAFEAHRRAGGRVVDFPLSVLRRPDLVLAIMIAPLGLFVYMTFLFVRMGDGLAFQHVQRAWGRIIADPLWFLWIGLTHMPQQGIWPSQPQQLALTALAGLGLTGVLFWRRKHAAGIFSLLCLTVPLFAGLASMIRFVAAQAPLMIELSILLARRPALFIVALLGFLVADYFFTLGWLDGYVSLI